MLAVEAEGTGPLEYQWLHGGEIIDGATDASFLVEAAQASDSGSYRVLVHNVAGTCISPASSVAFPPP